MDLTQNFAKHLSVMRDRADAALAASGFDHLLIYSGSLHYAFLDDNAYPFKVNPHFKRWIPVTDNPQCLVIYTPQQKPVLAFYSPVDFWHSVHPVPNDFWTEHFDIHPVAGLDDIAKLLPKKLDRTAFIGEMPPALASHGVGNVNPEDLLHHLHYDFAWKTDYEVDCIREANRLAARGHLAAERAFRNGKTEYEIHLAYLEATEHVDTQLPYGNIVALNEHAAVLHSGYQSRRKPDEIRSFLIDAGCTFNGYASDVTRTYSARNDEFQQLIDRMERSQGALCDAVKPGMNFSELQALTRRHVAEILLEFELAKGDADALIQSGVVSAFMPHGVGHYLGAQVHDVGGKISNAKGKPIPQPEKEPYLRLTREIDVDQVFTVEPGLYFIDSLLDGLRDGKAEDFVNWKRVDEFRPYGGIRIEDNVRVTEDGHENLTRPAFESETQG